MTRSATSILRNSIDHIALECNTQLCTRCHSFLGGAASLLQRSIRVSAPSAPDRHRRGGVNARVNSGSPRPRKRILHIFDPRSPTATEPVTYPEVAKLTTDDVPATNEQPLNAAEIPVRSRSRASESNDNGSNAGEDTMRREAAAQADVKAAASTAAAEAVTGVATSSAASSSSSDEMEPASSHASVGESRSMNAVNQSSLPVL